MDNQNMNHPWLLNCSPYYQPLMAPVAEEAPCGESLDYDPAFILLQSRLQPKMGVEYGSFVEAAEPVNWAETEHECQALLQKSKDVRLIIILMRCRLRKIGLPALAEGTEALHALLHIWPDDFHPQLLDEDEFTPMLRANAFAELEDINGLLADLRSQPLPKAAGLQIGIKEFEKAHGVPREEGALSDTAVAALVHEWQSCARDEIRPLTQAAGFMQEIQKKLVATLGDEAPTLAALHRILGLFTAEFGNEAPVAVCLPDAPASGQETPVVEAPTSTPVSVTLTTPHKNITSRTDALHRLQEVRSWFAMTEPSSPLIQVLKYAEDSIGQNFADLLKMYPPEIVAILNQEKE